MGVDHDAVFIVGYKINLPEDIEDTDEYLDDICNRISTHHAYIGSHYTGELEYYIVPKHDYRGVEGVQKAIEVLPRIKNALEQEEVDFDPEPKIFAGLLVW